MLWKKFDLDEKECVLEFAEDENYKYQAEIIRLEPIFGSYLFGNFDINVLVFNKMGWQIEKFELHGLNGKFKGAMKQLDKLKGKALKKYNVLISQ